MDFPVPKFLMMDDGDYLAMVEPRVKAALGKNFSVYRSEPFFLEILPRGIDKAQSLERLLEVSGLSREQMIACGDGYNDLSMIRYAGLGVAMEKQCCRSGRRRIISLPSTTTTESQWWWSSSCWRRGRTVVFINIFCKWLDLKTLMC